MAKPKRVPIEFLGAFKAGHRRGVREYIDDDFSYQLLEKAQKGDPKAIEALAWITKYNNETYRGVLKKGDPNSLHNTPELYKSATDGHNARRRDMQNIINTHDQSRIIHLDAESLNPDANHILDNVLMNKRELNQEDVVLDLVSPKAKRKCVDALLALPKKVRPKKP